MTTHVVCQGECLSSIALRYGFADYRKVLDDPKNAEFKRARPHPDILYPGDKIFIPEKERREEAVQTEQRHVFKVKRARRRLRVRFLNAFGEPVAKEDFVLRVAGEQLEAGTTTDQGEIDLELAPDARDVEIEIAGTVYEVGLLQLDPVTTVQGIQGRLNNLGYFCGRVDGILGRNTRRALAEFQRAEQREDLQVEISGEPETATLERLSERHDGENTAGQESLRGEVKSSTAEEDAAGPAEEDAEVVFEDVEEGPDEDEDDQYDGF